MVDIQYGKSPKCSGCQVCLRPRYKGVTGGTAGGALNVHTNVPLTVHQSPQPKKALPIWLYPLELLSRAMTAFFFREEKRSGFIFSLQMFDSEVTSCPNTYSYCCQSEHTFRPNNSTIHDMTTWLLMPFIYTPTKKNFISCEYKLLWIIKNDGKID